MKFKWAMKKVLKALFSKEAILLVIELIFIIFRNDNEHDDPYY